jgi:hypothetical protein
MKTTSPIHWIVPAILLAVPLATPAQHTDIPYEKKMQMHHEVPDDPYMPGPVGKNNTSAPYRIRSAGFTMIQVNVDANGQNILGDAANEPSLAVDPLHPDKMVIGWRQFDNVLSNFRQAGYGYTTNGGWTWTFPGKINPGIFRSDPVLNSDSSGKIYFNSLTTDGVNYYCKVFRSTNDGVTWDGGVDAHGGDKQWMTIDRSGGIGLGNIYATWNSYFSSCLPGYFTRSTDGGDSFENCLVVPAGPFWGTLTVGNNGELYVSGAGGPNFVVVKSTNAKDPGVTPTWASTVGVDLDGYINAYEHINPLGLVGQVSIDVDRSTGPGRDNVYVLCSVVRISNIDSADVMFSRSTDGGLTWSPPVQVNDDQSTDNYQWFGTMSVAPNGRIDAIWLDTRDSPPGAFLSALYYSYSLDQGDTWSVNQKLSPLFDSRIGWPDQAKMGDYFDMQSDVDGARLAWCNTLNGEQDVYYSYINTFNTGIDGNKGDANRYALSCHPNPFLTQTTIHYSIPSDCPVDIAVISVYGQEIKTLVSKTQSAGNYSILLSGDDLPAGFYLCRLKAGSHTETTRLVKLN